MGQTKPESLLHGKRFFIVIFLFFQVVINQADRVNLSIAAPAIAKHFRWDAATMGWVFAAYLFCWACSHPLSPAIWSGETGSFNTAFGISGALGLVDAILSLTMTRKPVRAPAQLGVAP